MQRNIDGKIKKGVISKGDVTLVPHGANSTWESAEGQASTLQFLLLPDLWASLEEVTHVSSAQIALRDDLSTPDPFVEQLSHTLLAEVQSLQPGGELYSQMLEQTLALHLLRHYSETTPKVSLNLKRTDRFSLSLEYIEAHLSQTLSLATLAALEGLSIYHYARAFKVAIGQTPYAYVIRQRVQRAQQLLRTTNSPLAQVALEVGFANQSHLNRHFKKILGITPAMYRQATARTYKQSART
ncbi:MAG: AraC family transcriptional regulator [Deinococcota bacterium]